MKKKLTKKKLTPTQQAERKERRKKIFRVFDDLFHGAVKIWLTIHPDQVAKPYVVLASEAEEFAKAMIDGTAEPVPHELPTVPKQ